MVFRSEIFCFRGTHVSGGFANGLFAVSRSPCMQFSVARFFAATECPLFFIVLSLTSFVPDPKRLYSNAPRCCGTRPLPAPLKPQLRASRLPSWYPCSDTVPGFPFLFFPQAMVRVFTGSIFETPVWILRRSELIALGLVWFFPVG